MLRSVNWFRTVLAMQFDDWILALHLLSAITAGAAITLFWVLVVAFRRTDLPEATVGISDVARLGSIVIGVGILGTIVFGGWLAISLDAYQLWDAWVIVAIVLWLVAEETGRRGGVAYQRAGERARELREAGETGPSAELSALNRSSSALMLHAVSTVVFLLILADMIWKPGA